MAVRVYGMISAEQIAAELLTACSRNAYRLPRIPPRPVVHSDDPAQLGFDSRVQVLAPPQLLRRPVQQLPHCGVLVQRLLALAAEPILTFDTGREPRSRLARTG